MSEILCKTRTALSLATMCVGCLLFTFHPVARSEERDDSGFVPLFNRQDMSGWETTGNWGFEPDGTLALRPKSRRLRLLPDHKSFLWSKATYEDFVLDLEFKVAEKGNSGVFLRSSSSVQLHPDANPRLPWKRGTPRQERLWRRGRCGGPQQEHGETGRRVESHDHHVPPGSAAGRTERGGSDQPRPQRIRKNPDGGAPAESASKIKTVRCPSATPESRN